MGRRALIFETFARRVSALHKSISLPGALLLLGAAFGIAMGATLFLRSLPVMICIDLEDPADELTARWPGGSARLDAIETRFAPHHFTVQVTARGPDDARGGFQMIAMAPVERAQFSNEAQWTNISNFYLLHEGPRPAQVALEGWAIGPDPYLIFERDLISEPVELQSTEDIPTRLILHSEEHSQVRYAIQPDRRLYRYIGEVPRRALGHLRIDSGGALAPTVHRLFVNAFLPRIYYSEAAPENQPMGIVSEHWAAAWEAGAFPIPAAPYLGASRVFTFTTCFIFILIALGVSSLGLGWLVRRLREAWCAHPVDRVTRVRLKVFGAFAVPLLLAWCTFLLTFYPGTMISDSVNQWAEMKVFQFTTQHPPIYALAMWVASCVWDSPATLALFQVLAGVAVLALAFALLWEAGVNRVVVIAVYSAALVSPRNNTMMIALVKDTPYAICMLLATVCLAWVVLRPGRTNGWQWVGIGLGLGLAAILRYNGLMMAVAALPLMLLVQPRQWRGWLVAAALLVGIFGVVQHGIYKHIDIDAGEGGLHDMTTCHLAILLDRDVPLTNDEYAYLAQVRDLDDRWAYAARRADSTWLPFADCYHRSWAKENSAAFFERYKRITTRNMLNASMYFIERGEFLYVPWERNSDMEEYFLGISANRMGLSNFDIFLELPDQFRSLLVWSAEPHASWLFWRPALPLMLTILACVVVCVRQRTITWCAIYAPFLINTATIALAAISQAARYQYPVALAAGFLVALAFLPRLTGKSVQTRT